MTKHPSVPTAAQCGERRIGVSVKTLASFFARKSLAKILTERLQRARWSERRQRILSFVTAMPTLAREIYNAEPSYGGAAIYV
jgi:hypothetical protein